MRQVQLRPGRLRFPEAAAGFLGIALVAVLVAVAWYHLTGPAALCGAGTSCAHGGLAHRPRTLAGWQSFTVLRWAVLASAILAVTLAWTQIAHRAPAVPVSIAVLLSTVGLLAALWLLLRLLVSSPAAHSATAAGGWIEFVLLLGAVAAGIASLRREGILERDGPGEVPVVDSMIGVTGRGHPLSGPVPPPGSTPS